MNLVQVHVLENGVFDYGQNLINARLYDFKMQFVREQECFSDTWFMVVPVANIPGLVFHSSQPIGLKNCFEPRQSKRNTEWILFMHVVKNCALDYIYNLLSLHD